MTDKLMVDKVLLRAAEIVEAGWCQYRYTMPAGTGLGDVLTPNLIGIGRAQAGVDRFCLMGALAKATMEIKGLDNKDATAMSIFGEHEMEGAVDRLDRRIMGRGQGLLAPWNDTPGRTADEVAALLRAEAHA